MKTGSSALFCLCFFLQHYKKVIGMKLLLFFAVICTQFSPYFSLAQTEQGPLLKNAVREPGVTVDPVKRYARTGGVITQRGDGPKILLVNCCDPVHEKTLRVIRDSLEKITGLPCDVTNTDSKLTDIFEFANKYLSDPGTAAVVVMGQSDIYPSMLVAPENAWGFFNITFLRADGCSDSVLKDRIVKQGWRTLAATLGSIYSTTSICLMKPVGKASDLDSLNLYTISPEPLAKLDSQAKRLGVKQMKRTLYSIAVKEGWAPAPTNDVQKAIWQRHNKTPPKN